MIDLSLMDLTQIDPTAMISNHFSFREALYLPTWKRIGGPSDGLTHAVLERLGWFLRTKMDPVREWIGAPLHVHCCWRPLIYNKLIGGAGHSTHMALVDYQGKPLEDEEKIAAIDFDAEGYEGSEGCDKLRRMLLPHLEEWNLRMEDRPKSNWIHLDSSPPIPPLFHHFVKG